MNVIMIGPDRSVHGGISAVVNNYFEAGLDKKVNIRYIATMKEGGKAKKLFIALKAYAEFLCCLRSADIIHIHMASDSSFWRKSLFIRTACRYRNRRSRTASGSNALPRIIIHQHGGDFVNYHDHTVSSDVRDKMDRILRMSDLMLTLTPSWKDYFSRIIPSDRILVLPNAVPSVKDPCLSRPSGDYKNILYLGRICETKGISELLDCVTGLHANDPEIRLYLGGIYENRTPADRQIRSRIESNDSFIHYLGWLDSDKKNELWKKCGITVLPSHFEGFGLVLIEAMFHGSVAVGTRVGGIPEIITDKETGLLTDPCNSDSLYDALLSLIKDPHMAMEISRNAYKKATDNYSIESTLQNLIRIYEKLLS